MKDRLIESDSLGAKAFILPKDLEDAKVTKETYHK